MPIDNLKQINKAVYKIDEKNLWCMPCAIRMAEPDGVVETFGEPYVTSSVNCTECLASAAGWHPALKTKKIEAYKDALLAIASGNSDDCAKVAVEALEANGVKMHEIADGQWVEAQL